MIYTRDKILSDFNGLKEEDYKVFSKKLIPDAKEESVLGIRLPVLRGYADELLRCGEGEQFLLRFEPTLLEEKLLFAYVLGKIKLSVEEKTRFMQKYVPMITNWEECDCAVSAFKFIAKNKERFYPYLLDLISFGKPYEVRFALYCFTYYYLSGGYEDKVIDIAVRIKSEHYYVKMAVAYLLATACIKYSRKVFEVLEDRALDKFTHNKTISKIRESYRVDKSQKDKALTLRINNI